MAGKEEETKYVFVNNVDSYTGGIISKVRTHIDSVVYCLYFTLGYLNYFVLRYRRGGTWLCPRQGHN